MSDFVKEFRVKTSKIFNKDRGTNFQKSHRNFVITFDLKSPNDSELSYILHLSAAMLKHL